MKPLTNITYRRLVATDSGEYRKIRLECLKAHPESFGSTFAEQSRLPKLMFERALEEMATDRFLIGAFAGDKLIGIFGFVQKNQYGLENTGSAIQMYVRAEHRGRKIGLGLTRATIQEAFKLPNINQLLLGVMPGNVRATRVYEQAGFLELYVDEAPSLENDAHQQIMYIRRE